MPATYTINPSYYNDVANGVIPQGAVVTSSGPVANTGWNVLSYRTSPTSNMHVSFAYNPETKEVLKQDGLSSGFAWTVDSLNSVLTAGDSGLFKFAGVTRSPQFGVKKTSESWNATHDALVKELEGLTGQVTGQSVVYSQVQVGTDEAGRPIYTQVPSTVVSTNQTVLNRIKEIQEQLSAVQVPESQEQKLQQLLGEFEKAREDATKANEQRYQQLTGIQTDANGNPIPGTTPMDYQQRQQAVMDYYNSLMGQAGVGANDPTLAAQLQAGQQGLASGWQGLTDRVNATLDQIGAAGHQDIRDTYSQRFGDLEQNMIDRGMGNTTVRTAAQGQLAGQENRDIGAFNEQLANMRLGVQQNLGIGALQSQENQLGQTLGLGLQGLGYQARAGDVMAGLTGDTLGVIERRTDTGPSLSDIWNATTQMGQGASSRTLLNSMTPQNMYQSQNPFAIGGTNSYSQRS